MQTKKKHYKVIKSFGAITGYATPIQVKRGEILAIIAQDRGNTTFLILSTGTPVIVMNKIFHEHTRRFRSNYIRLLYY